MHFTHAALFLKRTGKIFFTNLNEVNWKLMSSVITCRTTDASGSHTFWKLSREPRKLEAFIILRASFQDGLTQGRSGSGSTGLRRRWKSRRQASMMRMMRWGGLASLRTVAMWAGLMVCRAASASSRAGRAASSFSMAWALSTCNQYQSPPALHSPTDVDTRPYAHCIWQRGWRGQRHEVRALCRKVEASGEWGWLRN